MYHARVYVALKKGVLDPQGATIKRALDSMEFTGVEEVRVGKTFDIWVDAQDKEEVERTLEQMCSKLLANPVIEEYRFEVMEG